MCFVLSSSIILILQTANPVTLALSATGHAAMDCVMNNMVERGDVVLIAENGIWGERAGDMASRHGERSLIFVQC